ncbi:endonuclease/exonuclease/phosphatase family protein [Streptomyces eurythermus]
MRLVLWNLKKDGGPDKADGSFPDDWAAAMRFLARLEPDILPRQEVTYSDLRDNARLQAGEELLGMKGYLTPNGAGRNPTALFLKPETFPVSERGPYDGRFWRTPPTIVSARFADVPEVPLLLMSWHAAYNSPLGRQREADEVTAFVDLMARRRGGIIGAGDCNEYPVQQGEVLPPIDWSQVTDTRHLHHRTTLAPDGSRVSCTYWDRTMETVGLRDAARYAAHQLGQTGALAATAGHDRPDQGGPIRIDRLDPDAHLARAVREVRVHKTPWSDHDAVEVVFSRRLFVQGLRREVEPVPPPQWAFVPAA